MFGIQYKLTTGTWIFIHGLFQSRKEAEGHMALHCSSIIHKRVWPYLPHYRSHR